MYQLLFTCITLEIIISIVTSFFLIPFIVCIHNLTITIIVFEEPNSKRNHGQFVQSLSFYCRQLSVSSFPITAAVTVPWFLGEVKGYSKLYQTMPTSWSSFALELLGFLMFTDFGVYWIHRCEHHPMLYSWLHKQHHAWKISTPYASFAFHPLVYFLFTHIVTI